MQLPKNATELLNIIPTNETREWECKSAQSLEKSQLKKVLGKQVSAFANSGGGYLVFGVSRPTVLDPWSLEACPVVVGRTAMEDYLSQMVSQSVSDTIRGFHVHPLDFDENDKRRIYVIEIEDSPNAPHQSTEDNTYYWRLPGESKPAPHFHVKNLFHRYTECCIRAEFVDECSAFIREKYVIAVTLRLAISNESRTLAKPVGVWVQLLGNGHWRLDDEFFEISHLYPKRTEVRGVRLLGNVTDLLNRGYRSTSPHDYFLEILKGLVVQVQCQSQNYAGEVVGFEAEECISRHVIVDACKSSDILQRFS